LDEVPKAEPTKEPPVVSLCGGHISLRSESVKNKFGDLPYLETGTKDPPKTFVLLQKQFSIGKINFLICFNILH